MTPTILVLILAMAAGTVAPLAAAETRLPRLSRQQEQLLQKGEVVVRSLKEPGGQPEKIQAAIIIAAPVERVWQTMLDCEGAPKFVPGLRECEVLEHQQDADIIKHRVKFSWFIPEVQYVFRARYKKPQRIDFEKISGDLREMEGSWLLISRDGGAGTLVVYSVFLDPGFFIPQWLVSLILQMDLPAVLFSLRQQVLHPSP